MTTWGLRTSHLVLACCGHAAFECLAIFSQFLLMKGEQIRRRQKMMQEEKKNRVEGIHTRTGQWWETQSIAASSYGGSKNMQHSFLSARNYGKYLSRKIIWERHKPNHTLYSVRISSLLEGCFSRHFGYVAWGVSLAAPAAVFSSSTVTIAWPSWSCWDRVPVPTFVLTLRSIVVLFYAVREDGFGLATG